MRIGSHYLDSVDFSREMKGGSQRLMPNTRGVVGGQLPGTVMADVSGGLLKSHSFTIFIFFFFLVVGLYICPARKQGLLQDRNGFYFISPVYV